MKSFGVILTSMVNEYKGLNISLPLKEYILKNENLNLLASCCSDYGIDFSAEKIREFLVKLFTNDPKGQSFDKHPSVNLQVDNAPYQYKVIDYNKFKNQNDSNMKVQPECTNDNCKEQAYFGLPFCPWCMKQMPPFIPKIKKECNASVTPIMNLSDLDVTPISKEKQVMFAGAYHDKDKIMIQDGKVSITYGDVADEMKIISKYIP